MLEYLPELRDENEFGEIKMKTIVLNISPIEVMNIASGFQDYLYRVYFPKITPPFKCLIYCRNKRPLIAFADYLYCGYWQTDVCEISGYNREASENAFDIINDKICGEFVCDGYKKIKDFSWDIFEWTISNVKMYDVPREIKEYGIKKAPARYLILTNKLNSSEKLNSCKN